MRGSSCNSIAIARQEGRFEKEGWRVRKDGSRFWANPDPSPDGASVVFYSQVGPEGDLYVARSDGTGGLRQLTDDAALDRVPRWSPDGSRVLFLQGGGVFSAPASGGTEGV